MSLSNSMHRTWLAVAVALVVFCRPAPSWARWDYDQSIRGCALIQANGSRGSGVLIDAKKRLIITARHVVGTQDLVKVVFPLFDGKGRVIRDERVYLFQMKRLSMPAKVIYADAWRDVAILQLTGALPAGVQAVSLAPRSSLPNERLHLIGCAGLGEGGMFSYCDGVVRNRFPRATSGRVLNGKRILEMRIASNHGDSGGPLFNEDGQLAGIISQGTDGIPVASGPFHAKQVVDHDVDVSEIRAALFRSQAVWLQKFTELTDKDKKDPIHKTYYKKYPIKMEPGYRYVIDMVGDRDKTGKRDLDCLLELRGLDGKLVVDNDDRGDGLHSRVVFVTKKQANYDIIATTLGPQEGRFMLRVTRFREIQVKTIKGEVKKTAPKDRVLVGRPRMIHDLCLQRNRLHVIEVQGKTMTPIIRLETVQGDHVGFQSALMRADRTARLEWWPQPIEKYRLYVAPYSAPGTYTLTVRAYEPAGR